MSSPPSTPNSEPVDHENEDDDDEDSDNEYPLFEELDYGNEPVEGYHHNDYDEGDDHGWGHEEQEQDPHPLMFLLYEHNYEGIDSWIKDAPESHLADMLVVAIFRGDLYATSFVLTHPLVNVNCLDYNGFPLVISSLLRRWKNEQSIKCYLELLIDPRLDINATCNDGATACSVAVLNSEMVAFEYILAVRGREVVTETSITTPTGKIITDTLFGWNKRWHEDSIMGTAFEMDLEKFEKDPVGFMLFLRDRYDIPPTIASFLFVTTVYLCDGLLNFKEASPANTERPFTYEASRWHDCVRFLNVATRLPQELQMFLCQRTAGVANMDIIPKVDRDHAFGVTGIHEDLNWHAPTEEE